MSDYRTPLRQWIENHNDGCYNSRDREVQVLAGWYDWFCRDTSLLGKTNALAPKVKRLAKSPKINQDTMYVWFKNNCPMNGILYDDIRFADLKTHETVYTIVPRCGHANRRGQSEVWGKENGFQKPLVCGTWKDVLAFFGI